jgi:hypothetical protein
VFADLVYRANVGMIESRCGTCFTAKALKDLRISCDIFREEFERNETAKLEILGL